MQTGDIIAWVAVGLAFLFVGGVGVAGIIVSLYEEARAKKERRERALLRAQEVDEEDWIS